MPNTSKRGFASMNDEKQRLIAAKGGRAAHTKGTAHEWSTAEARAAGRKGGESRGNHIRIPSDAENSQALMVLPPTMQAISANAGYKLQQVQG